MSKILTHFQVFNQISIVFSLESYNYSSKGIKSNVKNISYKITF